MREYQAEDIQPLWQLYKNSFPFPCQFTQFADAVVKDRTFIAEENGRIKGFLTTFIDDGSPWVWTVVVNRFSRKMGIGALLIKTAEEHYSSLGYGHMLLYVEDDNPAQKLYFDCGYRVVKVEKGIYKFSNALKMIKHF